MHEKDFTEKTLEAYGDVFADIVNGLLFDGKQVLNEEKLIDAQSVSLYKADGHLHEQERDVAKYWTDPQGNIVNYRIAFLGIENQTAYDKDMPLRVIGYDGAAYRAELSRKERYPVVTLVLYFGNERWGKNRSLFDVIDIPPELRPYVNDYRINVFEIAHLSEEQVHNFKSDFRIVADFFVHKRIDPSYEPRDPQTLMHVDELLKLMSVLTRDTRYIEVERKGEKPTNMCEVLDRIEARGIEIGEARGSLRILAGLVTDKILSPAEAAERAHMPLDEFEQAASSLLAENVVQIGTNRHR